MLEFFFGIIGLWIEEKRGKYEIGLVYEDDDELGMMMNWVYEIGLVCEDDDELGMMNWLSPDENMPAGSFPSGSGGNENMPVLSSPPFSTWSVSEQPRPAVFSCVSTATRDDEQLSTAEHQPEPEPNQNQPLSGFTQPFSSLNQPFLGVNS
ncbi:hypothetical protein LWI29_036019 [Acer saccharum]|uniref:Uncharacterized protein n=1 Tax=Acer saccharum TaxID=4024 RepID=A0AA39SV82_ACESA|nr:hypothetical protein LWI29_036019 [Acer saccharum]